MKLELNVTKEFDVKFLKAECGVRYWEDGVVNGETDSDSEPKMPFSSANGWSPLIDVDAGTIVDWPEGVVASIHYKVCDAGVYSLLDEGKNLIATISDYVPDILSPGGQGYGDYVIMDIDGTGKISNWRPSFDEWDKRED